MICKNYTEIQSKKSKNGTKKSLLLGWPKSTLHDHLCHLHSAPKSLNSLHSTNWVWNYKYPMHKHMKISADRNKVKLFRSNQTFHIMTHNNSKQDVPCFYERFIWMISSCYLHYFLFVLVLLCNFSAGIINSEISPCYPFRKKKITCNAFDYIYVEEYIKVDYICIEIKIKKTKKLNEKKLINSINKHHNSFYMFHSNQEYRACKQDSSGTPQLQPIENNYHLRQCNRLWTQSKAGFEQMFSHGFVWSLSISPPRALCNHHENYWNLMLH